VYLDGRLSETWRRLVPVVAFAAVAGFSAAHWSALVVEPAPWRTLLVVVVTTVGGAAIAAVRRPAAREWRATAARCAILLATGAAALASIGVAPALLWPGGWDELADGLGRGLTGLRTLEWPYGDPDHWVRLTVLIAIPLTLSAAAALTFWPRGTRTPRASGLLLLLALYGIATSQHDVGSPLVQGAMLLLLLGAWLFLPRLRRGGALVGLAMLIAALGVSLPLATGLATEEPIIDYRSWRWLGDPTRYEWNHAYGPIDWPRRGETLLTVESPRPHYWKAAALDRFDGLRWVRSDTAASTGPDPLIPPDAPSRWTTEVEVTVGALDSSLLLTPGSTQEVEGVEGATPTRDGAARADEEVEQGAAYTVSAYAPNPSVDRMRAAPDPSPLALRSATLIHLPPEGRTNLDVLEGADDAESSIPGRPVALPRYSDGLGGTPGAESYVAESAYGPVYQLARRLVAGAATTYDAVQRVEAHLREQYEYDEQPPHAEYPLAAFLFEDRAGYCQQFSGAMALMLRMNGIPARVATGFAPGQRASDSEFTVRDLDAHSWVEIYFSGIGWVPFDPTPPGAPTSSRADGALATAARGDEGELGFDLAETLDANAGASSDAGGRPASDAGGEQGAGSSHGWDGSWLVAVLAAAVLLGGGALLARARLRHRGGGDAAVRELERALRQLGHPVAPGCTLMDLERRLEAAGRKAAARYVRGVREHRFGERRPPADAAARRALRSALTAGGGPFGAARGYLTLPPRRA
jgi:transglutaminase-like putative cysteine protease